MLVGDPQESLDVLGLTSLSKRKAKKAREKLAKCAGYGWNR